jgi:hypothetical protein
MRGGSSLGGAVAGGGQGRHDQKGYAQAHQFVNDGCFQVVTSLTRTEHVYPIV